MKATVLVVHADGTQELVEKEIVVPTPPAGLKDGEETEQNREE